MAKKSIVQKNELATTLIEQLRNEIKNLKNEIKNLKAETYLTASEVMDIYLHWAD